MVDLRQRVFTFGKGQSQGNMGMKSLVSPTFINLVTSFHISTWIEILFSAQIYPVETINSPDDDVWKMYARMHHCSKCAS